MSKEDTMPETKMDREQFEALIGMLDAIYGAVRGWESSAGRTKALDYVGRERGIARGYITREEAHAD